MSEMEIRNDSVNASIDSLSSGKANVYSSFTGDDFATKVAVLNAVTNSTPIADNLGKTIKLANVVVQSVEMENEQTGELANQPRVILIDDKGAAFHAISGGILKSVENLFGILGHPSTWPGPVSVQIVEEKSRRGFRFYTIKLA